jgi:hypothetical protein
MLYGIAVVCKADNFLTVGTLRLDLFVFSDTTRTKRCLARSAATKRPRQRRCRCPPEATSTADRVKECQKTRMKKVILL